MPFDRRILDFYDKLNLHFEENRPTIYGHINFVSIGGSSNDKLIRSDLISLSTDHPLDMSILTTAIDDVILFFILVCFHLLNFFVSLGLGLSRSPLHRLVSSADDQVESNSL